jgi:hypothetical protein
MSRIESRVSIKVPVGLRITLVACVRTRPPNIQYAARRRRLRNSGMEPGRSTICDQPVEFDPVGHHSLCDSKHGGFRRPG